MTYDITISNQGTVVHTVQGIEAPDALAAITRVEEEKEFKQILIQLPFIYGALLEFEARQLDFSLS